MSPAMGVEWPPGVADGFLEWPPGVTDEETVAAGDELDAGALRVKSRMRSWD